MLPPQPTRLLLAILAVFTPAAEHRSLGTEALLTVLLSVSIYSGAHQLSSHAYCSPNITREVIISAVTECEEEAQPSCALRKSTADQGVGKACWGMSGNSSRF